jgi:glutaredoxin
MAAEESGAVERPGGRLISAVVTRSFAPNGEHHRDPIARDNPSVRPRIAEVIGLEGCRPTADAIALLQDHHWDVRARVLPRDEATDALLSDSRVDSSHRTFPAVFLNGVFVGGFDDLERVLTN